jgi:hypothetical protein
MGVRLVFVHGIGGPRDPAEELRMWTRALAQGMREAGHSEVAAQLMCGRFDTTFASYADEFEPGQQQGGGTGGVDEETAALLLDLLVDLIDQEIKALESDRGQDSAARSTHVPDVEEGRKILAHARAGTVLDAQQQGVMGLVRRCLDVATTLLELKPWRRLGQWTAPRLMVRELAQVVRYLERAEADGAGVTLDARIRGRVALALGEGPAVVVAHSLGTVVTWETLHQHATPVPLFVTLGSPLSMRTFVWPRIRPRPPRTPECVGRWLNFYDRDDPIAARPELEKDIEPNSSLVRPVTRRSDADGLWVHPAAAYLAQPGVAGPVAEALVTAERDHT